MLDRLGSMLGNRPSHAAVPFANSPHRIERSEKAGGSRKQTYAKVFRWRLPRGQKLEPSRVEVVGSFTEWQPVPLLRDKAMNAWQVTLNEVPGNRTHHYMLLADGQPVYDHSCDGLAIPSGAEEERYQISTGRGPRVFMLFAQTK